MKRLMVVILMFIALKLNAQWIQYTMPYNGFAYTLGFYDINRGLSFGHTMFPFNQNMYYTTNSGSNWLFANYPAQLRAIADVQYIDAMTIYASGSENMGGMNRNYSLESFKLFPRLIRERLEQEGKSENVIPDYKSAFIKSTDGGVNWERGSVFDTLTGYVDDIHFFDASTGYALIDSTMYGNTRFYKTMNAGVNWNYVCKIDSAEVDRMIFFDMNTGIAKGFCFGGRIYRTTNSGLNWAIKEMPTQIDCITFFNSTTGIAMGISGTGGNTNIYKTTDGGIQWNTIATIPLVQYQNVKTLPNTGIAFAVGNLFDTAMFTYGRITTLKTTDYGQNWTLKEFNPSMLMFGLAMIDTNNYFISGGDISNSALILKSTTGGNVFVSSAGNEIPISFKLWQNYPNPFNPMTNVKFSILNADNVKIFVYDVLGREVQTLVDERLQAGSYEVKFDGSKFNSGVYFYSMVTEGYIETRKMLLLK